MKTPQEKRRHARVALFQEYLLELDGKHYKGFTGNISLGGAYLHNITPPLPQDKLTKTGRITLDLEGTTIRMSCQIVFIGTGEIPKLEGVGVAFLGTDPRVMKKLQDFLLKKI